MTTSKKLLIGVQHTDEKEIDLVMGTFVHGMPQSAGLELPEGYLDRERMGVTGYFYETASRLRNSGVRIIPLEDPKLFDSFGSVDLAKNVREGRDSAEYIEASLKSIKSSLPYTPPEAIYGRAYYVRLYSEALRTLKENPTVEGITALWISLNRRRDDYMFRRITENNPPVVIIGDGHARELKPRLSDYEHVTFR